MTTPDIRDPNRRAVDYSVEIVSQLTPDDLGKPTPCAAWTVADLLAHMTAQHRGFAAAARGKGSDLSVWTVRPLAAHPVRDYTEAAADVTAAYAEPGTLERMFDLPEFGPDVQAPGSMAIGFHFIDYVVHGWDMARALGLLYLLDEPLAQPALDIALTVPTGDYRTVAQAAFGPDLPAPETADPLERILTFLGRSPAWPR